MADLLCALSLLSALMSQCAPPPSLATGYVEGEYVQVAPLVTARISAVPVRPGDLVDAGQVLAQVETADAQAALDNAEAGLQRAESELADLMHGSRPEELAALQAALAAAQANAVRAAEDAEREDRLQARGVSSQSQSAALRATADVARAAVAEAEARLEAARLPARADRIEAARAAVAAARAGRETSRWHLAERSLTARAPGVITDIIRHPGEVAGPSAPVLTYLPEGAIKLRVFVPEAALSQLSVGTRLSVTCDGCLPLTARITWIADRPEFTPPVIYSRETRQKLVYMVEAAPEPAGTLKPGQIVEVQTLP